MHGGMAAKYKKGHKKRGGTPQTTGLYSRYLRDPEEKRVYKDAEVDNLDEEIRIAKAKLSWAIRKHRDAPDGGVITARSSGVGGDSTKIQLWIDIVERHLDNVRKLVATRASIRSNTQPDEDLKGYEEWVAANRSQ